MKTLTITEGRARLGYWLRKAVQGEDIGFVFEGKVVVIRPVEVHSADYALQEYGLSEREMAAAEKKISEEIKSARSRGNFHPQIGKENLRMPYRFGLETDFRSSKGCSHVRFCRGPR